MNPKLSLQKSEMQYRRLFETAQDGILILDAKTGKITDVNPFLENLLGYPKEAFLGSELWEIGPFKDIKESKEAFIKLQKEKYVRYEDLPLETKDGRPIDVEFVSNVYEVDNETVIQCNIRDITERKNIEKALAIVKANEDAILLSIGDGIIATDEQDKIVVMNIAAQKMLGWNVMEVMGGLISEIVPVEDELGKPILLAGGITSIPNALCTKRDKTKFPVAINANHIFLAGKVIGTVIILRDTTRERALDQAKNSFISVASHQLRTPLSAIYWVLESLVSSLESGQLNDQQKRYLEDLTISTNRTIKLIEDLLKTSRIQLGTRETVKTKIDIVAYLQKCIEEKKIYLKSKQHDIILKIEGFAADYPSITMDSRALDTIMNNLIDNATEYSPANTTVKIGVTKEDEAVKISISNQDPAIPQTEQERIFEMFFRGEEAKKIKPEGSGLGLYIVKTLVEGLGGKIDFESVEGKDTTFWFTIPTIAQNL